MDNKQILEKAIQRAIDGGYDMPGHGANWRAIEIDNFYGVTELRVEMYMGGSEVTNVFSVRDIIFNHDFAKALFGVHEVCSIEGREPRYLENDKYRGSCDCFVSDEWGGCNTDEAWQYHLRQMVVADAPIKYLGENI